MIVRTIVKSIQDIMRQDVGVDGDAQRIGQLCWMFFLKIIDDQDQELELTKDGYRSPISKPFQWRNWAADPEGITGQALLDFINDELFPALKELKPTGKPGDRRRVVRDVFEDAYNYMKSGQLIRQVVNKINEVDFNDLDERRHFGEFYEQLLNDLQSAGNAGEYYTPRAVTAFMVDRIDPHPGEILFDPACGTGGFLTCAIRHMEKNYVRTPKQREKMQGALRAVEKKQLPHMLCVTNMLLHGIEDPSFVRHDNTLARPLISWSKDERVDIVLTNPPFGGKEEDGIENNFPTFRTKETADLFLALIVRLLKNDGRAAVVLPDGTLFGEGIKTRLKEHLMEECNLHTIVRLPNSVFKPYASIGTNLLFFEKGSPTKDIWFYDLIHLVSGQHLQPSEYSEDPKVGIPYITGPSDFGAERLQITRFALVRKAVAKKGQLLLTVKGSGVGKTATCDIPEVAISRQLMALTAIEWDARFLMVVTHRLAEELQDEARSLIPGISREDVEEFVLPLPPLTEQHRIVAKVDELIALSDRLEAARANREALRDRLAAASLARLNAPDPETFQADARFALNALPALTTRPDQIRQLRATILNLAVRGKLVEQNPRDEPASELLQRIAKENARLIKDGKAKRQDTLPEVDVEQAPFELPSGWAWGRFPELGTFGRGKSKHRPRNDPALFDGGEHLMIQTGDVARSQGVIQTYTSKYNDLGLAQSFKWPRGTLCITIAANIADSGILSFDACFPDSVVGFIPTSMFENARYFEYFVRTAKANLLEFAPATAQKNINLEILTQVLIPLPPLAEQHRIVAKIDGLMVLCDRLEASLAASAATRRRLLDALLAEALAPAEDRELEAAE